MNSILVLIFVLLVFAAIIVSVNCQLFTAPRVTKGSNCIIDSKSGFIDKNSGMCLPVIDD